MNQFVMERHFALTGPKGESGPPPGQSGPPPEVVSKRTFPFDSDRKFF